MKVNTILFVLFLLIINSRPQPADLHGYVIDTLGNPIVGAKVEALNLHMQAITSNTGFFNITDITSSKKPFRCVPQRSISLPQNNTAIYRLNGKIIKNPSFKDMRNLCNGLYIYTNSFGLNAPFINIQSKRIIMPLVTFPNKTFELSKKSVTSDSTIDTLLVKTTKYRTARIQLTSFQMDLGNIVLKALDPKWILVDSTFPARFGHQCVVRNDTAWCVGGKGVSGKYCGCKNDVWRSTDAVHWNNIVPNAPFSARSDFTLTFFKDKMWLIGGIDSSGRMFNDIWSSVDGISWVKIQSDSLPWAASWSSTSIVYDNKIWLIGGYHYGNTYFPNTIFNSNDGIIWHELMYNNLPARAMHSNIVFDNKMWVIAGRMDITFVGFGNDTWASIDGNYWEEALTNSNLTAMFSHSTILLKDTLYTVGGENLFPLNTIYKLIY